MHARIADSYNDAMNERDAARSELHQYARRMLDAGLVVGSAGNVSRRLAGQPDLIAITPTSITYDVLQPEQIVFVDLTSGASVESQLPASSELPMHLAIYRARRDVGAVVHTHAPFVSTLAVVRRRLPPVIDEMLLYFGGTIDVAEYAFTGTEALGESVVRALADCPGAIVANHGNVCIGSDLERAMHAAIAMEASARVYVQALMIGRPIALPVDAIAKGRARFETRSL
jgi:L-fuculose-phosphate aldolase